MKSYRKELWFNTEKRYQFVHLTEQVMNAVKESGVKEGLCLVNAMHITSSVFINDNESGLHQDYMEWLEKLAPYSRDGYHHNVGEDNGDAHLKRQIMGREVVVVVFVKLGQQIKADPCFRVKAFFAVPLEAKDRRQTDAGDVLGLSFDVLVMRAAPLRQRQIPVTANVGAIGLKPAPLPVPLRPQTDHFHFFANRQFEGGGIQRLRRAMRSSQGEAGEKVAPVHKSHHLFPRR